MAKGHRSLHRKRKPAAKPKRLLFKTERRRRVAARHEYVRRKREHEIFHFGRIRWVWKHRGQSIRMYPDARGR